MSLGALSGIYDCNDACLGKHAGGRCGPHACLVHTCACVKHISIKKMFLFPDSSCTCTVHVTCMLAVLFVFKVFKFAEL